MYLSYEEYEELTEKARLADALEEVNTKLKVRLFEAEETVAELLFQELHEAILAEVDKNFPTKVYRGVRHV